MSWIKDVRAALHHMDASPRALARFGWAVGGVLLLLGAWAWRHKRVGLAAGLLAAGALLVLLGSVKPALLRAVHRPWMAFAFALGWVVSRVLLAFVFFAVLTPISLLARLVGKRFLDTRFRAAVPSYWVTPPPPTSHEKMY